MAKTWGRLRRLNPTKTNSLALAALAPLVKPLLSPLIKFRWAGGVFVPKSGSAILVANHISSLDPVLLGLFLAHNGRWPHYLARANLWDNRLLRHLLETSGQIPVFRDSDQASDALRQAKASLASGNTVIIYPEGTITFDPQEWPMTIHTGVARLAIATGAPVIPVGQWGANFVLPPRKIRPLQLRRHLVTTVAGEPLEIPRGEEEDRELVARVSKQIFDAIWRQTCLARGESGPDTIWSQRFNKRVACDDVLY